ncbi:MAG: PEGA domain-containing protein, partial [Gammaproteobacteria bacterium]|nr:PEGA domain-containing protein [Gammaproteobacteria bacterium]
VARYTPRFCTDRALRDPNRATASPRPGIFRHALTLGAFFFASVFLLSGCGTSLVEEEIKQAAGQPASIPVLVEEAASIEEAVPVEDKRGKSQATRPDTPTSRDPADSSADLDEEIFWGYVKKRKNPDLYRVYLRDYPNGRFAAIAKNSIEALIPENISGKTAQLVVRSNVTGDTVYVDYLPVGASGPVTHTLAAGEHTVQVEKAGYQLFETRIELAPGAQQTLRARLETATQDPHEASDITDYGIGAYSGANRSPIPAQPDHRFRNEPDHQFRCARPPIPVKSITSSGLYQGLAKSCPKERQSNAG